jgi:GTP cyclohydrolase II
MTDKKLTKEQLLKAIEKLENNPHDNLETLGDLGIGVVGAVGGGAAAFAFGGTTASILFGLVTIPVAAPLGVVAGAAILGGAALVGVKKKCLDGTRIEGKREEILQQLKEQLREVEAEERASQLKERDKIKFINLLEEALKRNLISSEDAHDLKRAVENGQMLLAEAIKIIEDLIKPEEL